MVTDMEDTWVTDTGIIEEDLGIDGSEVCVRIEDDVLRVVSPDGEQTIGAARALLIDDPVFSDAEAVFGTVVAVDGDAEQRWSSILESDQGDVNRVEHNGVSFEPWAVVEHASSALLTPDDVLVITPEPIVGGGR